MSTPLFSILLPTVQSRCDLFAVLHTEVQRQAAGKPVEVIVACDNKEISIGKKRQNLIEQATGDYVAHIDDDDWIAPSYVDDILAALATGPDCVGFEITCTFNGGEPQRAITSLRYNVWGDNQDGYRFNRSIYHKSCIKREHALAAGFRDLRYAEDKFFSDAVQRHLKTEVFIPKVLYFYRHRREPFLAKYGFKPGSTPNKDAHKVNYSYRRRPFQH
jgi:glycosyltransferase involved in cell wall biosynthesis